MSDLKDRTLTSLFVVLDVRQVRATESPITRIFGGKFRSTLKVPHQKDSVLIEDWRSLPLDIQVCPNFLILIYNNLI